MDLVVDVHGYISIVLKDVPKEIEKRLDAELGLLLRRSLSEDDEESAVAVLTFLNEVEMPVWKDCISLGQGGPYADTKLGLFWHIDKYGAPTCLDLKRSSKDQWHLKVSKRVVPLNFVEYVLRGWILRPFLLRQNISFVHASAVAYREHGILFSAWGGTGKTNLVLKFLENGAAYMSDDLALLSDTGKLLAYPERINIFDYNAKNISTLKRFVPTKSKILFSVKDLIEFTYAQVGTALPNQSNLRATLKRVADLSGSLGVIPVAPTDVFPNVQIVKQTQLTHVFHMFRSTGRTMHVERVSSIKQMAKQMAACLHYEYKYCDPIYDAFLFAFPQYYQEEINAFFVTQEKILADACKDIHCYYVYVPKNTPAEHLFRVLQLYVD